MPNTQRDIPDLLAQFADGGAPKNIIPQKHRDLIVSLAFVKPYRKTASYVLVLTDAGVAIEMNVAGANTLTIPPHSSVPFDVGAVLEIVQYGAGQVTLTPGAGVTIHGVSLTTRAQWSVVSIRQSTIDEWIAAGDLT